MNGSIIPPLPTVPPGPQAPAPSRATAHADVLLHLVCARAWQPSLAPALLELAGGLAGLRGGLQGLLGASSVGAPEPDAASCADPAAESVPNAALPKPSGGLPGSLDTADVARSAAPAAVRPVGAALRAALPAPLWTELRRGAAAPAVRAALEWATAGSRRIFALGEPGYPGWLAPLPDAPLVLFAEGAPAALAPAQVAIVGARDASPHACRFATALAEDLGRAGFGIVSGLARGVDAAAHRGALRAGAPTTAVFGQGLGTVYPRQHAALARDIVAGGGLLLGEMPPSTPVARHLFPRRNRLIAGLGLAVVVVEAAARSGSLITARLAAEYGREVLAVPGVAGSPARAGCHRLLRDGAQLVESAADVLDALPAWWREAATPAAPCAEVLLEALAAGPLGFDALVERSGVRTADAAAALTQLELGARVLRLDGDRYARR